MKIEEKREKEPVHPYRLPRPDNKESLHGGSNDESRIGEESKSMEPEFSMS
jgi:hypothetical protein